MSSDTAGAGIAACNDLAEYRQIRIDTEIALSAGNADTESGNDLIKYQQSAILVGQLLHTFNELFGYRTSTGFRSNRLKEHCGSTTVQPVFSQLAFQILQIIGEEFVGVLEHEIGNTA